MYAASVYTKKLKEKAASRNPDEFYFGISKSKVVNGVHRPKGEANKYTKEELMLMKTPDIGYSPQNSGGKKKVEKLNGMVHCLDNRSSNKHTYYAEDRFVVFRALLAIIDIFEMCIVEVHAFFYSFSCVASSLADVYFCSPSIS